MLHVLCGLLAAIDPTPAPAPDPAPAPTDPPADAPAGEPTTGDPADQPVDDDIAAALAADAADTSKRPPPAPGGGVAQSLNPDLAVIADVGLAWSSEDGADNGLALGEVELAIGKEVDPYFRFDGNLVFGAEGAEVEEAYATTLDLPHSLQARAGQFLTRFGRQNSTHPHTWDLVDRPFALERVFGGEGNRGAGVELSWLTPLSWYVELVGSVTDARGGETNRSFLGDSERAVKTPLDLQDTLAAKSFHELSPDLSLLWGVSYATGPSGLRRGDRTDVVGVDGYLKYRPITRQSFTIVALTSEWLYRRRQVPGATLTDVSGYGQLFWRFAQRWGAAARYEYGSAASGGDDPLDPAWTEARQRAALALTFWPSEFSRLRAQASLDAPGWLDDPIVTGFFSLEVAVGAHGAHSF